MVLHEPEGQRFQHTYFAHMTENNVYKDDFLFLEKMKKDLNTLLTTPVDVYSKVYNPDMLHYIPTNLDPANLTQNVTQKTIRLADPKKLTFIQAYFTDEQKDIKARLYNIGPLLPRNNPNNRQ